MNIGASPRTVVSKHYHRSQFSATGRIVFVAMWLFCAVIGVPPTSVQARPLEAGIPTPSINIPAEIFIGDTVDFTVSFDNTSLTDVGYGPFLDVMFPDTGIDGDDGLVYVDATYLGIHLTPAPWVYTFSGAGPTYCVNHPYAVDSSGAPVQVCGNLGETLVVLLLPFGSFVPDQPRIDVSITADLSQLADLGAGLSVRARAGFQFGNTPLNDFSTDPSILSGWTSQDISPTLITLEKVYNGPEDETATGPNYHRTYTLTADIADDQPMTDFCITDLLDNNVQYVGVTGGDPSDYDVTVEPSTITPTNPTANQLTVCWPDVTGGTDNPTFTYEFYIPLLDANGDRVLDPTTGDDAYSEDDASAFGDWDPIDVRDDVVHVVSDVVHPDHILEDQSDAIQKEVGIALDINGPGLTPGDILRYSLHIQISDFFAFDDLYVSDDISDGQRWYTDSTYYPTLSVNGNQYVLGVDTFDSGNYVITNHYSPGGVAPVDGSTNVRFNVSDEIERRNADTGGWLVGGCIPVDVSLTSGGLDGASFDCGAYNNGATTAEIVFYTRVQENYSDDFPSGDQSVDQGDTLENAVIVDGHILSEDDLSYTSETEDDDSGTDLVIERGLIYKSIYAINGDTSVPSPVRIAAGDEVTYRITYTLPTSDVEDMGFRDYLPLPIFNSDGDFSTTAVPINAAIAGTVPPAGEATFGPSDTFYAYSGLVPTVQAYDSENSLEFFYGDFDDTRDLNTVVDLLFTVTVTNDPFADGLFLTNQVRAHEGSTVLTENNQDAIIQLILTEPDLEITKGVLDADQGTISGSTGTLTFDVNSAGCPAYTGGIVSSDYLDSNSLDYDLSDADAGDQALVAIVLENTGSGLRGAFDVTVEDVLPSGVEYVAGSLCVTDGAGTALPFTGDLFSGGIILTDDNINDYGALDPYNTSTQSTGTNLALVTYRVRLQTAVESGASYTNTAEITNFAGDEGGPNFVAEELSDDANISTLSPTADKNLIGSEINDATNTNSEVVIGELAQYQLILTVPEGTTPGLAIQDTLDSGLAFVGCDSITASTGLSTSLTGGFSDACDDPTNPVTTSPGQSVTWTLGDITNSNTDNATAETITIVYTAVTLNVIGNQTGTQLNNSAVVSWSHGTLAAVESDLLTVTEPGVSLVKTVDGLANGTPGTGDAGNTIYYTLTLQNTGVEDAWDVTLDDALPLVSAGGVSLINIANPATAVSVVDSAGIYTTTDVQLTGSDGTGWTLSNTSGTSFDMPVIPPAGVSPRTISITVTGIVSDSVNPNQTYANTANVQWTSLNGAITDRSSYNSDSDERTGTGGTLNDYFTAEAENYFVPAPVLVKSIVQTSEGSTSESGDPRPVAIGEIVRYHLAVEIPESTMTNVSLVDLIPNTYMRFLMESPNTTVSLAFVGDTPSGISSSTMGTAPWISGSDPATTPTYDIPASAILSASGDAAFTDGEDVTIALGDITNTDDDPNAEYLILEFNGLVLNVDGVTHDLVNQYQLVINGSTFSSNQVTVRIVVPTLTITKSATPATNLDAGATVAYDIRVQASNTATSTTAFDVTVTDVYDARLSCTVGTTASGWTASIDTGTRTYTASTTSMTPGTDIHLFMNCTILDTAQAGFTIPNTASVVYSSLPGTQGTTSNTTGSITPLPSGTLGERSFNASGSRSITGVNPAVDKRTPTPTQYTIGETITYPILVTLPEGTTTNLNVRDTIPTGLVYTGYLVITDTTTPGSLLTQAYGGTVTASPTVTGTTPRNFAFGDVVTTGDNITSNNTFQIMVYVRVDNVIGNQDAGTRTNTGSLRFQDPDSPVGTLTTINDATAPGAITMIEPVVRVVKSIFTTPSPSDAGGSVMYQVVINRQDARAITAYDVMFTDTLPASLSGVSFSSITRSGASCTMTVPSVEVTGNVFRIPNTADSTFDLPQGCTLTIQFTASLTDSVRTGETIQNTTNSTTWSTLDGTSANERDGSGICLWASTPACLNDYEVTSNATFDISNAVTIVKSMVDSTSTLTTNPSLTIGEEGTFALLVTIPEGTTQTLRVSDVLPTNLTYVGYSVVTTTAGSYGLLSQPFAGTLTATPTVTTPAGEDGGTLTVDFGNVVNPGDNNTSNNSFVILVRARLRNILANQQVVTFNNGANVSYVDPETGTTTVNAIPVAVNVVEPIPTLAKDVVTFPAPSDAGGHVTYQVQIANPSTMTASDMVFTDDLPADLENVNVISVTSSNTGLLPNPDSLVTGNTVRVPSTGSFDLPVGVTVTIVVEADLSDAVSTAATITNTGRIDWTSLDGTDSNERTGVDGVLDGGTLNDYRVTDPAPFDISSVVTVNKYLVATSSNLTSGNDLTIGETATFVLVVSLPEGTTRDLVITDDFPAGLEYVNSSIVTTASGSYGYLVNDFDGALPAATLTPPTGPGGTLTLEFGDQITYGDTDNIPDNNEFVILITARLVNIIDSQAGVTWNNHAHLTYTDPESGDVTLNTADVPVDVVEPVISITKSVEDTPIPVDAGGEVGFVVTLSNTSGMTASDMVFTDQLPTELGNVTSATLDTVDAGTCSMVNATLAYSGNTITFPQSGTYTMLDGCSITIHFTAILQDSVNPTEVVTNTGDVAWTSLEGADAYERNSTDSCLWAATPACLNDYESQSDAAITASNPIDIVKSIISTSSNLTSGADLTIGEEVIFGLLVTLPEGTTEDVVVTDTLPAGLEYVSSSVETTTAGSSLLTENFNGTLPVPTLTTVTGPGGSMEYDFGTVVVTGDNDGDNNQFVIIVTARLTNIMSNQAGASMDNNARLDYTLPVTGASFINADPVTVNVVEPVVAINKAIESSPVPVDAGGVVGFVVTLSNTSGMTAPDTVFTDTLPTEYGDILSSSIELNASCSSVNSTEGISGHTITFPATGIYTMQDDCVVTLHYTAALADTVQPGQLVVNNGDVVWTSLTGIDVNERDSSDTCLWTAVPGCLNDYETMDDAYVTGSDSIGIVKAILATSASHTNGTDVTIGEVVTYDLAITLPEGTISSSNVVDVLPAGMIYVPGSMALNTAGFNGAFADPTDPAVSTSGTSGDDITFAFDQIVVSGDNVTSNNTFHISFQAYVVDEAGNTGYPTQTTLTNYTTLSVGSLPVETSNSVDVSVVEPRLTITKDIDLVNAGDGDPVTITLVVQNTGNSDAMDVVIEDPIDAAVFTNLTEGTTPAGFTYSYSGGTLRYTGGTILVGESRTFTVTAVIGDITPGTTYTNTATVTQDTTLPGIDALERDEPDENASDSINGTGPDMSLTKDDGVTTAHPGDVLQYAISVSNNGTHSTDGVVVTETVPVGTTFNAAQSSSGWSCTGTTCTYTIPGTYPAATTWPDIIFAVTVDASIPAAQTQIYNYASVTDSGLHGSDPTDDNDDDDTDDISAFPVITVVKSVDVTFAEPGDTITYTLVVTNTGDRDASDVVLSDTIDSHTNMVSVSTDTGTTNYTAGVDAFSVNIGTLAGAGGTATITVVVTVDDPIAAGIEDVRNSGVVSGSNFTDVPSNEVVTPIDAAPDLVITKTDGDTTSVPGGVVVYTLTYSNVGDQDATGVVITETVPTYSTFNAGASSAGWSCIGTTCTYTVGDLPAGAAAQTTNFAVTVDSTLPSGVDEIYNLTSIDDDHSNGTDPTPLDNSDDDTTPIIANPELSVVKDDSVTDTTPGSILIYTIDYSNYGNQTADNVTLTETIPDYTLFTTTGSTTGWSCTTTTCTLNLGSLNPGDTGSATFVVIVDNPVPSGADTIYNYVTIEDDHTNGDETNLDDNESEDTDTLIAVPDLRITKDDGQDQVAAGSQLAYSIVVENVGSQDATGVIITDTLPAHTTFVSASNSGIESPTGTVTWPAFSLASGSSVTYTVTVDIDDELDPSVTSLTNTVIVADDGTNGADPTPTDNTDSDTDLVRGAEKFVNDSNQDWTNPPQVAIGEIIEYQVSIVVAANSNLPGLVLEDTLGQGLAFVGCTQIGSDPAGAVVPDATTGVAFSTVCGSPTVTTYPAGSTNAADAGRRVRFNFGGVTNTTGDDATLMIRYQVVVLDNAENLRGQSLTNNAEWQWGGNVIPVHSDVVNIVEPELQLVKEVSPGLLLPNNTATYTITMSHTAVSNSDAFDVVLTDPIPDGLEYVPSSLALVSGPTPDEITFIPGGTSGSIYVRWDTFPNDGVDAVISFTIRAAYLYPGHTYTNTANVAWTSLPGDVSSPQTGNNPLSTERTYDPASSVDIYGTNASVDLLAPYLPDTGFAPDRVTNIPVQQDSQQYTDTNNMRLEIPELNVDTSIVGVPLTNGNWDLTWLGNQAGWLEGTAYPTWNGNSAITAHVYDANGQPGLFVNLNTLSYGDQVIIHAYGQSYVYEVRSNTRIQAGDLDVLEHEENAWITLITCQGYNAQTNAYAWRVAVQAVLIRVEVDTNSH